MDLMRCGVWLLLLLVTTAMSTATSTAAVQAQAQIGASLPPLAAAAPANSSYASCADYKTCDECVAASYTCHFCEFDFQCHVIGSPSGCITGISTCHHLEDCKRQVPQYVGYGPPPAVVIAVLCLVVTLTCCCCGVVAICSVFLRRKKRARGFSDDDTAAAAAALLRKRAKQQQQKKKKQKATRADVDAEFAESQSEPLLLGADEHEVTAFDESGDSALLERLQARRERERSFTWRSFFVRLMTIATLVGITVFALMFYPRTPDYNVCNREFDWESILQSLRSFHPKIEYQVLISAINENRFGFMLEEGKADIYHNGTLVGYWKLESPLEAKAGSITDVIAPIKIEPGYSEAYALWTAFRNNELVFRINATVSGSIMWGSHKIYRISTAVDDIEFLVGAEYDRGLCKCTEYLTPQ